MSVHFRYALAISLLVFTGFMACSQKDSLAQQDIRCPCAADGICYPNRGQWGWQETQWRRWPSMPTQPGMEGPAQGRPRTVIPSHLPPSAYDETSLGPSGASQRQAAPAPNGESQRRPMPTPTESDPLLPQPTPMTQPIPQPPMSQPKTPAPPTVPKKDVDPFQDDPLQPAPAAARGSLQPPVKPTIPSDPAPVPKGDGEARHSFAPHAPSVVIRPNEPARQPTAAPQSRTIPAAHVGESLESTVPQKNIAPQKNAGTPSAATPSVAQPSVRPATAIAPIDRAAIDRAPALDSTVPQKNVAQQSAPQQRHLPQSIAPVHSNPPPGISSLESTVPQNVIRPEIAKPAPAAQPAAPRANPFQYAGTMPQATAGSQQPAPSSVKQAATATITDQPSADSSQPGKPGWQRFGYPATGANAPQSAPATAPHAVSTAAAHEPVAKPRGAEASRVHLAGAFPDLEEQRPAIATASYTVSDDGTGMSLEDSIPGAAQKAPAKSNTPATKPAQSPATKVQPSAVQPAAAIMEQSLESTVPSRPMIPSSPAAPSAAKLNAGSISAPVASPAAVAKPVYAVTPASALMPAAKPVAPSAVVAPTAAENNSRGLIRLEDSTPRTMAGNPLR